MAMLTLRDVVGLAQRGTTPIGKIMYESAVLGNYVLTPEQAASEVARKQSGIHLPDGGEGLARSGLPSGKTTDHITFGSESPYAIKGLRAAEGGEWESTGDTSYRYSPSAQTLAKYGKNTLLDYFKENEKGNTLNLLGSKQ